MDRQFSHPLRLGNGHTVITVASISEAGAFLLQHWPSKRRRRPSYRLAVQACVKALSGRIEPEAARQALIAALEDLAGKSSREETSAPRGSSERIAGDDDLRGSIT